MKDSQRRFKIILIHGFLGTGSDWDQIRTSRTLQAFGEICTPTLPCHGDSPVRLEKPDLNTMADWLAEYLNGLTSTTPAAVSQPQTQPQVLVGYSLGGRILLTLAAQMQACNSRLDNASAIAGMVIESAHPGLSAEDKPLRRLQDRQWAQRFASQTAEEALLAWYQQQVFSDLPQEERIALANQRSVNNLRDLAKVIVASSLAEQADYWNLLIHPPLPLYYWHGAKDRKFQQIGHRLSELRTNPTQQPTRGRRNTALALKVSEFSRAGHNCHLAEPAEYAQQLSAVLSELAF